MYARQPKPELHGHNPTCIGLPDEPCGRPIDPRVDYPSHFEGRNVMQYRCRSCEEKRVLRDVRATVRNNPKPLEE